LFELVLSRIIRHL